MKPILSSIGMAALILDGCGRPLRGTAEDLWGNRIDLARGRSGLTLIQPFSPANCGYCLVDGQFIEKNYLERTTAGGGTAFHMCLFSPQADVYAFLKHHRIEATPVITFPPDLHAYHRDGFPFLIAFRDGSPVYQGVLSPYDLIFEKLRATLWPEAKAALRLTSPAHLGTVNCLGGQTVWVAADGDTATNERLNKSARALNERMRSWVAGLLKGAGPIHVKYEGELVEGDLHHNLMFQGQTGAFRFDVLKDFEIPVAIGPQALRLGPYEFPAADVGLGVWFPNPRQPERFVRLELAGANVRQRYGENWVDYLVYAAPSDDGPPEVLLHGLFAKPESGPWQFSSAWAFAKPGLNATADVPPVATTPVSPRAPRRFDTPPPDMTRCGPLWTVGSRATRFPRLSAGPDGRCWAVWEEAGEILLCCPADSRTTVITVDEDTADSFSPVLASDGTRLWIVYLNDCQGFYRVTARSWDGRQLSHPIVLSAAEPCDAISPAVTGDGRGTIVVAWADWQANQRFLRYRHVRDGVPGEICTARLVETKDNYANAWCPALAFDADRRLIAAWNQHYPATLGVCAGDLEHPAASVTRLDADGTTEDGGYPTIVCDAQNRRWALWESFAWDVLSGKPQSILAACYDQQQQRWGTPQTVSHADQTVLNQTPRAAVDRAGVIWAVWSGRPSTTDLSRPWGIYLSRLHQETWSPPVLLSPNDENGRAPDIAVDARGRVWIAWQAGVGAGMRVRVLAYASKDLPADESPTHAARGVVLENSESDR